MNSFYYIRYSLVLEAMIYLDRFIDYLNYERNYSSKTVKAYRNDIEQFFQDMCFNSEECSLKELNVYNVRSWMVSLMDQGYSTASVKRKLSSLRVFSRYLLKIGEIKSDKLKLVEGPKSGKNLPEFIQAKDMDKLLEGEFFEKNFEGFRDKLMIDMFYSTGIRLAELVGLNDSDVDLASRQIKVLGKGNKERVIPFGSSLADSICEYLKERNTSIENRSGAFFIRSNGLRVYRNLVYKSVQSSLSTISTLVKCSPHVLRHSFATNMLNNGADLQVIKEILGHTSLSATEVYTHTTFKELKKVYNQAHPRA